MEQTSKHVTRYKDTYYAKKVDDIASTDQIGWQALHYAASEGHGEVVRVLLEHGADIHATVQVNIDNAWKKYHYI